MNPPILDDLKSKYAIVDVVDLGTWKPENYEIKQIWLEETLRGLRKESFEPNERIVFLYNSELKIKNENLGLVLKNLQVLANEVDISNPFILVLSGRDINDEERNIIKKISTDPQDIEIIVADSDSFCMTEIDHFPTSKREIYQYGSLNPIKILLSDLSEREQYLLSQSPTFCMYPWVHLHAWPTGQAFPCCHSEHSGQLGDTKSQPLEEIWNDQPLRKMRLDMLNDKPIEACKRCYEQEDSGFFSGRRSANKHHGHHIKWALETKEDGSVDRFNMTYWDIRFSNLCNLSCRSCGHIFSSSWYQDQVKLAGLEWAKNHKPLFWAGRHETDIWEQLLPHLDYVEQIYFAGGEPLMMDEHYRILEELERRGRFDVRLIYNTNFTQVKLKDRLVFDYWKKFKSVAVGASLDAMGPRAEYIRKGTEWAQVEANRSRMIEICPNVDFYISPTLSILNAWHLPDFHKNWVERGFIRHQDLNVNVLQDPQHYRLDIAPGDYKQRLKQKFEEHIEWIKPHDKLRRATVGFESAINYMMGTDNTHLIDKFWSKTDQLDNIRKEKLLDILPELEVLCENTAR